ncbi:ATP-dependent dethiobiotin synthetase BioD [Nonomuraea ferruginea]
MSVIVVTGTGSGVGKTVVCAALAALARTRGASAAVVKPAQTGVRPGERGDLDEVIRLSGVPTTFELARFEQPLSPAAAARAAGVPPVSLAQAALRIRELAESSRWWSWRARAGCWCASTRTARRSPTWPGCWARRCWS